MILHRLIKTFSPLINVGTKDFTLKMVNVTNCILLYNKIGQNIKGNIVLIATSEEKINF